MQRLAKPRAASNVLPIAPAVTERAFFEQLLQAFVAHRLNDGYDADSTTQHVSLIRRLSCFSEDRYDAPWPWEWQRYMGEEWIAYLRLGDESEAQRACVVPTLRGYQGSIRIFLEYLCDQRYPWQREIEARFGAHVTQLFDEFNSIKHYPEENGAKSSERFPIPRETIQQIFDYLDDTVARAKGKSILPAARDSALIKTLYAYGPRRREVALMEVFDLSFNAYVPEYGRIGALWIRHGKGAHGSGERTRLVRTVPLFEWSVEVLEQYLVDVRPRLVGAKSTLALFPSERGSFMSYTHLNDRWAEVRRELGLDKRVKLHSFRHSYMTHLLEAGYPAKFIQLQAGHGHLASMSTYTNKVGDEFCNTVLRAAHAAAFTPRTPQAAAKLLKRIVADEDVDDE